MPIPTVLAGLESAPRRLIRRLASRFASSGQPAALFIETASGTLVRFHAHRAYPIRQQRLSEVLAGSIARLAGDFLLFL
jgi:hypothetical protein